MATSNRWISPTKSHGWALTNPRFVSNRIRSLLLHLQKPLGSLLVSEGDTCGGATEWTDEVRSWHLLSFPFPEMQQQRRCQVQLVMASNLWTLGQSVVS